MQVELQPSPSRVLPSSQTSPAPMMPSPQTIFRVQGPCLIRGTVPVGFDLAGAVAPVAGQDVAVVTLLDAILIVDSVAAALWYLGLAARGAGGVAHLDRAAAAAAGPAGRVEMDATGSASAGSARPVLPVAPAPPALPPEPPCRQSMRCRSRFRPARELRQSRTLQAGLRTDQW